MFKTITNPNKVATPAAVPAPPAAKKPRKRATKKVQLSGDLPPPTVVVLSEERRQEILNASVDVARPNYSNCRVFAKCVYVHDGDTIHLVFFPPTGNVPVKLTCRLEGYDTPELKGPHKDAADAATAHLSQLILGKAFYVTLGKFDKYGRLLVTFNMSDIQPADPSATPAVDSTIAQHMISGGYAVSYHGGKKLTTSIVYV